MLKAVAPKVFPQANSLQQCLARAVEGQSSKLTTSQQEVGPDPSGKDQPASFKARETYTIEESHADHNVGCRVETTRIYIAHRQDESGSIESAKSKRGRVGKFTLANAYMITGRNYLAKRLW